MCSRFYLQDLQSGIGVLHELVFFVSFRYFSGVFLEFFFANEIVTVCRYAGTEKLTDISKQNK